MRKFTRILSLATTLSMALTIPLCAAFASGCGGKTVQPSQNEMPVTETPSDPSSKLPLSPAEIVSEDTEQVKVSISGKSEVRSGGTVKLTATVTGVEDKSVIWEVTEGKDVARIDESGRLTAQEVSEDRIVKVVATSNADKSAKAEKVVTVASRRALTQDMLDALDGMDEISYEGYVNIHLYTIGQFERYYQTHTTEVKTVMNGTNWYAGYENVTTGTYVGLYYKNHGGAACQVGVNFMNEEEYTPMTDESDAQVGWAEAGLYNTFKGLEVSDFTFNEQNWRYEYSGADDTFKARTMASANPYEFVPENIALIIEEDEIMGIYSRSEPDYTIAQGYKAVQELTAVINYGKTVETPTISKYPHDAVHDKLNEAVENMRGLERYTLDQTKTEGSVFASGYVTSCYVETVTPDMCHFSPYSLRYDAYGNETRVPTGEVYGYKKIDENLYNTFSKYEGGYEANRAYEADFSNARPSFAFAAEIFTMYYDDPEDGTTTYYADGLMCPVASTFYYGVGNDVALYGLYAAEGKTDSGSFTPFVVVKDGYIIRSGFYYNLGYMYGVIENNYGNFGTAELPQSTDIEFETRQVPVSWEQLTVRVSPEGGTDTSDDVEVNALEFLKEFFGDENIGERMPFFGKPLGDTFGFAMTALRISGANVAKQAIAFYYDVPLEADYSINKSLDKVRSYLVSLGFTKNVHGEYVKGDIVVSPVDADLDLMIYVWKD